jgi:hypothetical protein
LTDFGSDEKFVKGMAEAIPSDKAAVFVLVGKRLKDSAFVGSTGEAVLFFGTIRPPFRSGRVRGELRGGINSASTTVKEVSLLKRTLKASCSVEIITTNNLVRDLSSRRVGLRAM